MNLPVRVGLDLVAKAADVGVETAVAAGVATVGRCYEQLFAGDRLVSMLMEQTKTAARSLAALIAAISAEIDVRGLDIVKGRDGVFVHPSSTPLDITERIISAGIN
jgi:hypothetical protein